MCNYPDTEHGTSSTRTHTYLHTHTYVNTRSTHTAAKLAAQKVHLAKVEELRPLHVCACVCVGMCKWVSKHDCVYVCVCVGGLGVGVAALCCCRLCCCLCCYWHGKLTIFQLKSIPSAFFVGGRQWVCQGWVICSVSCVCKCLQVCASVCLVCRVCLSVVCCCAHFMKIA